MVAEPKNFALKWTYDEVTAIEDDVRRELYYGGIFEIPSPLIFHQTLIGRLLFQLTLWERQFGGHTFLSPLTSSLLQALASFQTSRFIPENKWRLER